MSQSRFEQYKAALRRGHMAALAGQLEAALAAYDEAARLVPERALPLASRGTVLHRLDRWPEAAESFDRALQLAPDDAAALRARASARAERGLRSGAAADFERLAFVLDVAGRAADAAEAARHATELEATPTREGLAARLEAAAAHLAEILPAAPSPMRETHLVETPGSSASDTAAGGLYDALDALRAGMDAEEGQADREHAAAAPPVEHPAAAPPGGTAPPASADSAVDAADAGDSGDVVEPPAAGEAWPRIDLPSPPPAPIEGPPPDPEELLAEAALVLESGEVEAARDRMLTAVQVHREAGRIDAALDVCLNLLAIAPGDPRVHLAIANLQLDRGWSVVAREKLDLLIRLTTLTGDTQAAADVHGLASERLRDEPAASTTGA